MKATLLKRLYPKVMDGLPVLGTPAEAALRHTNDEGAFDVDRLIRYYTAMSGATGFVTGLPGFLLLPVALPADLLGNAAIQLHMTTSIAIAAGFDPSDETVEQACIQCLLSHIADPGTNDENEELTKRTSVKLGERFIRFAAYRATKRVAHRAGRRLGFKRLPLLGGILGAGSDATLTRHVGACAKARFFPSPPADAPPEAS